MPSDDPAMTASDELFLHDPILPDDPVGTDGRALEVLHDREYRVRSYRVTDDVIVVRGAVRDQKPPGLYLSGDPEPLTVHHMQVDLEVRLPAMEIVDARVEFEMHPNATCPAIVEHYDRLIGLSIARGFTHRVRELFGGSRGCTHTTALLQAMAPVAVQTIWSLAAANANRAAEPDSAGGQPTEESLERRQQMWKGNLNTCHVWAEDSETVARMVAGEEMEAPLFARERMVKLGIKPEDWGATLRGE